MFAAFEGMECQVPRYHPRRLVNDSVLDRGVLTRVTQTWPAIFAPAVILASIVAFFVARLLDRLFAEQASAEISATKTMARTGAM